MAGSLRLAALAVVALGAWAGTASAQPGTEAGPAPSISGLAPLSEVPVLEAPPIDVQGALAAVRLASMAGGPGGGPVPFAEPFTVDVSPVGYGRWEAASDGETAVWRLRVVSEGAVSLNLGFARYRMPPGGRLRVHTLDGAEVLGPYTDADNEAHGELWTPVLPGGDAVIEVAVPVDRIGELDLGLASVNRGFRDLVSIASPSHSGCQVDVACSDGDGYRDQIRSVGHYSVSGTFQCSGALANNTAEDGKPYFLTAAHCFIDASRQVASVVVYWNYQRPACGSGDATRSDSQSGAVLRVERRDADIVLLELDDDPDPDHELYLAGWDSGSSAPPSAVGIHHPRVHYKSISTESDALTRTSYFNDAPAANGSYWRVSEWDTGGMEVGSSGSPLFGPNKRIVGVLRGGDEACGGDRSSWYGALTAAWTSSDGSSARQLSDWLDPGGTGAASRDGMDPNSKPRSLRALDDKAVKVPGDGETAESLTIDLAPFFVDPDGDALTYTAVSSSESAVTVSASGSSVTLTPVASGSATITVTVVDGNPGGSVTSTFRVTAGDNRSPETVGTLAAHTLNERVAAQVALAGAFTDGDGDTLTLAVSSTDTAVATASLVDSTVTVTAVDGPATATVDVTATDAGGSNTRARHRFDVTVLNEPPQAVGSLADVALHLGEGNQVVDVSSAFDDPDNEALTYAASSSAPEVARSTISGSRVTLTPVSLGSATITVTATDLDGSGMSATQTIAVRVKGPRGVTVSTDALTVVEGSTATYTVALDSEPTGEVTITPSVSSGGKATVSPSSLTFDAADWETAKTVTVEGVEDEDSDRESATIDHAVSGADYGSIAAASVSVRVEDDEAPPAPEPPLPSGGGGPPPEPEPEPEPEPPPPPPSRPPAASFAVEGATCDAELCRAVAGEALRFTDTSTGTVRFRRWEFSDGNTSRSGAPVHAWSLPGFHEVTLEVSDGSSPSTASRTFLVTAAEPAGTCAADAETLCLQDSRYAVTVEWRDGKGGAGAGRVVHAGTNDSGMFSFFDRANWEVLIKVLDGCSANGQVWVFGGSTTDLGHVIRVTDTATGAVREYRNEPGTAAAAITDVAAFTASCGSPSP